MRKFSIFTFRFSKQSGQMLVELVMAIGIAAIILPAILTGLITSREGRPQQQQRAQATALLKQTINAVRSIRDNDWTAFSTNGTFHPTITSNKWVFASNAITTNGFTQQVVINDVYRTTAGAITTTGGTLDPSTKKADVSISWSQPRLATVSATIYLTRTTNLAYTDTTQAQFNAGTSSNVQITNTAGGEITLSNNNRAKWCTPSFATSQIDLPDGPPVAVAATASAVTTSTPNDVFVAVAPYATTSAKLAYVNVTADTATPSATLHGTFTLDATKYSAGTYPASLGGLTNSFVTNDVKYYTSTGGNLYALLATSDPSHEIVVVKIKNNGTDVFQDSVNKIYKYWTFFNTKQYPASAGNDQAPFGYGAISITILGNTGYVDSSGYLYGFDLTNIDTATTTTSLPQVGCRMLLDGYDCKPGTGTDEKYRAGETGTSWSDTAAPVHNDCSDGGNIELNADHQLSSVQVGANKYVYVAVGGGTNPELDIADVSTPPTTSNTLSSSTCGRGSNVGWKEVGSLDFDTAANTEEAANSVYAKSDGTRAYMSSNGGIIHSGIPDSDQFYIIDTTTKSAPKFLQAWPSTVAGQHYINTAESGYYNGNSTNIELYPRRALTVQNGQRAVIVGQDGLPNDGIEPQEYQVLDLTNESTPTYCGGLNFSAGFNDLTSVTEANGDNYVYMVANTIEKQLKIIQGGPDNAIYVNNGTFTSQPIDASSTAAFNRFVADIQQSASTSVGVQLASALPGSSGCSNASYTYLGPGGTSNSTDVYTASGSGTTSIANLVPLLSSGSYQNPGRCLKYKAYLSTTDQSQTPTLYDMIVNYSL